jgi:hypothetical protein
MNGLEIGELAAFFSWAKELCGFLCNRYAFGLLDSGINIVQNVISPVHCLQVKIGRKRQLSVGCSSQTYRATLERPFVPWPPAMGTF